MATLSQTVGLQDGLLKLVQYIAPLIDGVGTIPDETQMRELGNMLTGMSPSGERAESLSNNWTALLTAATSANMGDFATILTDLHGKTKRLTGTATQSDVITLTNNTSTAVTKGSTPITSCLVYGFAFTETTAVTAGATLTIYDDTTEKWKGIISNTTNKTIDAGRTLPLPIEISTALKIKLSTASGDDIDVAITYTDKS